MTREQLQKSLDEWFPKGARVIPMFGEQADEIEMGEMAYFVPRLMVVETDALFIVALPINSLNGEVLLETTSIEDDGKWFKDGVSKLVTMSPGYAYLLSDLIPDVIQPELDKRRSEMLQYQDSYVET